MHETVQRLHLIKSKAKDILHKTQPKTIPQIIAVTKTFPLAKIIPLLDYGHIHFGENKIQETETKWNGARNKYTNLQLHLVGKLQSNKAKKAVQLFDYIHSLDNAKLASKIGQYEKELNKKMKLFIQVNIANEEQKTGIPLKNLNNFYNYCFKELSLNIIGLMCLPPINSDSEQYFKTLKKISLDLKLKNLSMGMSNDYENALLNGATHLRLGTAIFGERNI